MSKPIVVNAKQLSEVLDRFIGSGKEIDGVFSVDFTGMDVVSFAQLGTLASDAPRIAINPKTKEYYINSLESISLLKGVSVIYVNTEVGFYNAYDEMFNEIPIVGIDTFHVRKLLEHFVALPC